MLLPTLRVFFLILLVPGTDLCAGQEPEVPELPVPAVDSDTEAKPFSMRISAAKRDDLWMTRKKEGENRDGHYYPVGWAPQETLFLLEEIYAGSRICTDKFRLDGSMSRRMGHGCRSPNRFLVQFGERPETSSTLLFHHGRWNIVGESGFRLEITKEQEKALLAKEIWLSPEDGPQGEFSAIVADPLPWYGALGSNLRFVSPLSHVKGETPGGIKKAECLRTRTRRDPKNPSVLLDEVESIGFASAPALKALQRFLHGSRRSTLRRWPDGRTEELTAFARGSDWIECTMEDGQVLWLWHYPDLGFWKVKGEGPFRLDMDPRQTKELLAEAWWDKE